MSDESKLPQNKIIHGDSTEVLKEFPDESLQLAVTSPPYNIGKDYGDGIDDRQPLAEWRDMMQDVIEEVFRMLKPDGKMVINVGASFAKTNVEGRYFRIPLNHHIIEIAHEAGFDLYDEYVWTKKQFATHGGGALFGSYPYPTNFMANQQHEYILVFRKWVSEDYHSQRELPPTGTDKREDSAVTKEEWREYTQSVWDDIGSAKSSQLGIDHDAIYPVELPQRIIKLYSFVDDVVLDPFMGSGSTALAALEEDRYYLGVEMNEKYVEMARDRVRTDPVSGGERTRKRALDAHRNAEESGQEQSTLDDVGTDNEQ